VAVYRVEIPPGGVAGKHRHPVDTFVYVLSGTLTLEQEGQGSRTLKVGEVFQEVPGGNLQREEHRYQPPHAPGGLSGRQGPALFRSGEIGSTPCGAALARRSASGTRAALPLYHPAGHRQRTAQT
jgi:hypothetical protein